MSPNATNDGSDFHYDVVIVGGGPAGLAAALALGRARRRVLLCDAGPRRNAAASHIHNFVTRDGTTPSEFRRIGRAQLEPYANVAVAEAAVEAITGSCGEFSVRLSAKLVRARRVLLCTGMIDDGIDIDGFRELWGSSIFQCPYCHGWEIQNQNFGFLSPSAEMLEFAIFLRAWTHHVVAYTDSRFEVVPAVRDRLLQAGVILDERRITRLLAPDGKLAQIMFADGAISQTDALFARPPQRHVPIVQALALALNPMGYVVVDETRRETSIPGIYAAGDLLSPMQAAIVAAASATHAASVLNHGLVFELALQGQLP